MNMTPINKINQIETAMNMSIASSSMLCVFLFIALPNNLDSVQQTRGRFPN